nr:MAG TPA: hypothetical protein [Caudoviricetes sp.]
MWKNSYGSHTACIDRKYKEDTGERTPARQLYILIKGLPH